MFPKNSPVEGLTEVIRLLSWLVLIDEDAIFGVHNSKTVSLAQYLEKYVEVSDNRFRNCGDI